jgi:hypothetical protein
MRTDLATSSATDWSWIDAPEYQPYHLLYNLCEVRGLKMEVTIGQFASTGNKIIHSAKMFAGPATGVPTAATPDPGRAAGLPV